MENLEEKLVSHVFMRINIGGKDIPFITDAVLVTWIIMAALIVLSIWLTKNLKTVPQGKQHIVEALVEFVNNLAKDRIGHHYKAFAPYLGTILLYIAFSNLAGMFNILPSGGFLHRITGIEALSHFDVKLEPPTRNFNVTVCLALMTLVVVFIAEFKYKGVKGFIQSFYKPTPISGFVKLLDLAIRPMSLCLRLFGAVTGAVIVMLLVYLAFPLVAPIVPSMFFDIFDGLIQAYIFVFLTCIYIGEAVEEVE